MTLRQLDLTIAIDCQRQIASDRPNDPNEKLVLENLYRELRKTFAVVKPTEFSQYVYSPSRAVLKRI